MKKTWEGLLQIAEKERNAGQISQALGSFLRAAQFAKNNDDYPSVADALHRAGVTAKLFVGNAGSKYRDALNYLIAAKDLYKELNDEDNLGRVYRDIAVTHDYARQKAAALENFQRAIEIFEKNSNTNELALTYDKLGTHYSIHGDFNTAKEFIDKAFTYFQKAPSGYYQAITWHDLAKLLAKTGQTKEAIEWAEQSLQWYLADHDGVVFKRKLAQLYGLLSVLYDLSGREKLANNYATQYEKLLKGFDPEIFQILRQELAGTFGDEVQNSHY